ncbi:hypothetical protein J3R30DRAFT_3700137 [Lentinula aciculospora]|uniref:Uncharacterized protein n=1 Tax=Lentinula aciculospora TaxID=153920 RepID=A0A9W9DSQ6_9AGAR|nr:hypothetical protein J3R30DRAFT_3700137 [Lentinula aciculospora]
MGNLLWLFIGAGAATVYARRHQHEGFQSGGSAHGCHSRISRSSASPPEVAQPPSPQRDTFFPDAPWNNHSASAPPSQNIPNTSSTSSLDPWAAEKERMREIGSQVGVNVLEFSESTLDTLLTSIASMKARVVQQRLDREKQEEMKKAAGEQKPDPPRYV